MIMVVCLWMGTGLVIALARLGGWWSCFEGRWRTQLGILAGVVIAWPVLLLEPLSRISMREDVQHAAAARSLSAIFARLCVIVLLAVVAAAMFGSLGNPYPMRVSRDSVEIGLRLVASLVVLVLAASWWQRRRPIALRA